VIFKTESAQRRSGNCAALTTNRQAKLPQTEIRRRNVKQTGGLTAMLRWSASVGTLPNEQLKANTISQDINCSGGGSCGGGARENRSYDAAALHSTMRKVIRDR